MKRVQYDRRGPVPQDVLQVVDFELPVLAADQALVRVVAAPINPSDVLTLTGQYALLPPLPAIAGNEGAGVVVEIGAGVENLHVGQRVLLPVGAGSWTSHLVAKARRLIVLPDHGDMRQLSMLTINPPTAFLLLSDFVDLQPGDWVIQNVANSAVGSYLIQIAKSRGLKTVNVVRRQAAEAAAREAGADVVLVDGDDLARRVKAVVGPAKIRLGVDAVGGDATARLGTCLAEKATLVSYGAMSGQPCVIPPGYFIFRDISLTGFWLSRWFQHASLERHGQVFAELADMIATGKLHASVQAGYRLEDARAAIAAAASDERQGKILFEP